MTEVDALGAWTPAEEEGIKEQELWSLDATLTDYILPRITAFRKMERHGYPSNMDLDTIAEMEKNPNDQKWKVAEVRAIAEWEDVLRSIELAFNLMKKSEHFERSNQANKDIKIGLELFAKHYEHLWD
tara:strand:+ start:1182 stop:1565 length:384 start_codon:yes stop_codon:yes gene_type:complete